MVDEGSLQHSGLRSRLNLLGARLRQNFWDALGDLVGLALLGTLFLLLNLLRWWTIAVAPTLYCAIFFKKRKGFPAAFSSSPAGENSRDSMCIRRHFFILALVSTGVAIAMRGEVYPCLGAGRFAYLP
jgi:hypothetical protein